MIKRQLTHYPRVAIYTPLDMGGKTGLRSVFSFQGKGQDVNDFADETILELRPRQRISENGISDMLGFSADSIRRLLQAGYDDTLATLAKVEGTAPTVATKQPGAGPTAG